MLQFFTNKIKIYFFLCYYYPVVSIKTLLWSGRSGVLIPAGVRYFPLSENCPNWPLGTPSLLFKENRVVFRGKHARHVMLTTHFHLAPRLRMNGAVRLLPYTPWVRTDDFTSALYPWQCVVHNNVSCSVLNYHGNSETFQSLTKTDDFIACKTTVFTDLLYVMVFAWVSYTHVKHR
jgi:hypothetical protein